MSVRRAPPRLVRFVRMTDAEWSLIQAASAAAETYPSTWLREAAVRVARRELSKPKRDADR